MPSAFHSHEPTTIASGGVPICSLMAWVVVPPMLTLPLGEMRSLAVGEIVPKPTPPVVKMSSVDAFCASSANNLSNSSAIRSSSGMAMCVSHHHQLMASQTVAF